MFGFFSRGTRPILTRLGTNHPGVVVIGFKIVQMKGNVLLQVEIIKSKITLKI
jgi:hypothetical protein